MTTIKKILSLQILLFVFTACINDDIEEISIGTKKKDQLEKDYHLTLSNGRIVFSDEKKFLELIEDNEKIEGLKNVLKLNGFTPFGEKNGAVDLSYPNFISNLYNHKGEIQLGEQLVYIHKHTQYIISDKNEALLQKVKSDIALGAKPDYDGLKVHQIRQKLKPAEVKDNQRNIFTDARYQKKYQNDGPVMKFVFEAYLDCFFAGWNTNEIKTGVRSKFEWLHGRRWKPAGENVRKTISNLEMKITEINTRRLLFEKNLNFVRQEDKHNLEIKLPEFRTNKNNSFEIEFSGDFSSVVMHPGQARESYDENCYWKVSAYL